MGLVVVYLKKVAFVRRSEFSPGLGVSGWDPSVGVKRAKKRI